MSNKENWIGISDVLIENPAIYKMCTKYVEKDVFVYYRIFIGLLLLATDNGQLVE